MALQICMAPDGVAGPPLVTDDPGILDPGNWEVIIAVTGEDHPAGNDIHAPLLDMSLGLTKNTQMSFVLPHVVVKPTENPRKTGLGYAEAGFKWRIMSASKWELAIASNYVFPVSNEIIVADGPEDIRVLGVPLLVSRTDGNWDWFGQVGWNIGSDGIRFWDYGLAVGHPLGSSTQLMMEIFGSAASSFTESTLNYQLGLDYEINQALHVLASAGSRIKSGPERSSRLNYAFYIGLQWFN